MADTPRSLTDLQSLLADNTTGDISPQDLRDFLVSAIGVYGSLTCFDGSTAQTSLGTTPALLTCFTTDGSANGTTPANASDSITVNVAGNYDCYFQCSFSGTNSANVQFRLRNNAVEQSYGCTRKLGTGGDVGSASFIAPGITLAASDVLTIYVETDDAGGGDQITVVDAQFCVRMVG
jgi:hypothetical protein